MLSETGHLYLVDLGSAMFDHGKRKRICEGTKGYAAPEQYQGYLSPRSDIYALGKTMEKLCGKKEMAVFFISGIFLVSVSMYQKNRKNTDIWICQQFRKESRNWKSDIEQLPGENVFWKQLSQGF